MTTHITFRDGGSIAYSQSLESIRTVSGLFSLCFYFRDMMNFVERPVTNKGDVSDKRIDYLRGLYMYSQIVKQEPFRGWKCIFYTDQYTRTLFDTIGAETETVTTTAKNVISRLHPTLLKNMARYVVPLLHDEDVVFAVVDMPAHQRRTDVPQINGFVLRTMRYRALFDFPLQTVCIRDADTYFAMNSCYLPPVEQEKPRDCIDTYRKWEVTFLDTLKDEMHPLFVVGTSYSADYPPKLYWRAWHQNKKTGRRTPFGVLAGFINVLQDPAHPVAIFSMTVWDEFMDYIADRSVRTERYTSTLLTMMRTEKVGQYRSLTNVPIPSNAEAAAYKKNKIDRIIARGTSKLPPEQLHKYWNNAEKDKKYEFTNDSENERIGRDEQFPVFFLMPHALQHLCIYIIEFEDIVMPQFNKEKSDALLTLFKKTVEHNFQVDAWMEGSWMKRPTVHALALNSNTLAKIEPLSSNKGGCRHTRRGHRRASHARKVTLKRRKK